MKRYLHALAMAQSMFCAIPSPFRVWDEEARPKMLLFLPMIGLEIGLLWAVLGWLCALIQLPALLAGVALCAFPYVVTGFLHLDGFLDVVDAVRSWRDLDRRREILKDSHVGSFAVIAVVLLVLLQYSAASALGGKNFQALALIPVVSRCCSVLAIQWLPPMQTSQYAARQVHWMPPAVILALALGAGFWQGLAFGLTLISVAAVFCLALLRAYRSLRGMNGDISGYCISIAEAAGLCALALL